MATQQDPLAKYWLVDIDHPDVFPTPKRFLDDIGIKPTDDADFGQLGKDYTALYKEYLKASGAHEWQQEAMAQAVQRNFFDSAYTREEFDRLAALVGEIKGKKKRKVEEDDDDE